MMKLADAMVNEKTNRILVHNRDVTQVVVLLIDLDAVCVDNAVK